MLPQLNGQGPFETRINVLNWANSERFQAMTKIAQNPNLNYTVFLPGPIEAFEKQAAAQCLSLKEWLTEFATNPDMSAQYVQSFFVKGAYNSSTFTDGKGLPMFTRGQQPGDTLVLGRREV